MNISYITQDNQPASQPSQPSQPASAAQPSPAQSCSEKSTKELAPTQIVVPMHTTDPNLGEVGTIIRDRWGVPVE